MQNETIENYCKTILELDKGEGIKSVQIAKALGISKISVSLTLCKLKEEGYITMKKYGRVKLARKGILIAKKMCTKYDSIVSFLENCVGVEKSKAKKEACAIEHCLSDETVKRLLEMCRKGRR